MLASSKKIKYDGLFHEDGSSQLELWMQDEGLKEQMFLELIKIDAANAKGTSETIGHNIPDELEKKEVEFMKAYFNIKNQKELKEKENFFISHGINFMDLHGLVFQNDEEISGANEENHTNTNDVKWEEKEVPPLIFNFKIIKIFIKIVDFNKLYYNNFKKIKKFYSAKSTCIENINTNKNKK